MAKPMSKGKAAPKSNVKTWLLVAAVVLIIGLALPSEEVPASRPKRKVTKKSSGAQAGLVTKADFTAKFPTFTERPVDAFRPAVFRRKPEPTNLPSKITADGVVPGDLGGDGNWVYTGQAQIDGATLGLLENRNSGEGVFVRPNENWNGNLIVTIADQFIVIRDKRGDLRTVKIGGPEATPPPEPGVLPLRPTLQGAIGRIDVQPLPPADAEIVPPFENTTRRRRRGRQNNSGTPDAN